MGVAQNVGGAGSVGGFPRPLEQFWREIEQGKKKDKKSHMASQSQSGQMLY